MAPHRIFCFETADSWSAGFSLSDARISLKAGLQRLRRAKEKTLWHLMRLDFVGFTVIVPVATWLVPLPDNN